jgi:tetratricopeptide (TPR) repeat protein
LLMMRAKAAMDAQQMDVALKLLDAVIKLRPDYVEGWNRRATLYYLQNDYAHSLEDIEQVLVANRAISARWPDLAGSCRISATKSARLTPSARRSPSTRISKRCRNWSRP